MALRHNSSIVRHLTSKHFDKKHIVLGKIIQFWSQIIGKKLFHQTQPLSVRYRKDKEKNTVAVLRISVPSAYAPIVNAQKGLILERLNMLINKPKFIDFTLDHQFKGEGPLKKQEKENQEAVKKQKNFEHLLESIEEEEDLKIRLKSFLKAVSLDITKRS